MDNSGDENVFEDLDIQQKPVPLTSSGQSVLTITGQI